MPGLADSHFDKMVTADVLQRNCFSSQFCQFCKRATIGVSVPVDKTIYATMVAISSLAPGKVRFVLSDEENKSGHKVELAATIF